MTVDRTIKLTLPLRQFPTATLTKEAEPTPRDLRERLRTLVAVTLSCGAKLKLPSRLESKMRRARMYVYA